MPANQDDRRNAGPRWWPLLLLLALTAVRLVQVWVFKDYERQFKYAATGQFLRFALPAALVWFLVLSRLPWRVRLAGLGGLVLVLGVGASLLRFRGIDGDGLPVVEWRWRTGGVVPPVPSTAGPSAPQPPSVAGAEEFPQFQGPRRDARFPEARIGTNWNAQPPVVVWRQPVGEGWSGFAVARGKAVSQEQVDTQEVVFALDLATGRRLWSSAYPARYASADAGNGPRAVPTIVGDRVFTVGATGKVGCRDLDTGRVLWQADLVADVGARLPEWGYSASPLVVDGLVWLPAGAPGRSLVALDALTGRLRFGGGDSPAAYSSPMVARIGGQDQILILNDAGLAGHDAADGRKLWEHPIPPAPHVAAPVVIGGDRILVSVGYGKGSFLVGVGRDGTGGWTNGLVWKSIRLKSKFANVIVDGDTAYGLDDGALVAVDLATGGLRWKEKRFGHGQLVRAGGQLLVSAESGEIVLVDAQVGGMVELGRFRALADKTWNPPAMAGRLWLMRNDREAVCVRLPNP